ncbi:Glycosyltransferase [Leclercia adecarboxylata]|uniref:glycosyltransferase n=1 Tax=Leclercia adecarboxylata TaxID=83655 RepID=UPI003B248B3D
MLEQEHINLIQESGLFNSDWYKDQYPDVAITGLSPLEHFVKYGFYLGRNPGPNFNNEFYLSQNPDVKKAAAHPLIHYIKYGIDEGRTPLQFTLSATDCAIRIDIIVPVYNALNDVKQCLKSLKDKKDGYDVRAIVVNDGSDEETTLWLREFCAENNDFELHEHPSNRGYTQAVNTGLRVSNAPYVITQNSDTIATNGWLRGLIRCINSSHKIGIAGPLSNAASWQNVPDLYDENRHFAINEIPNNLSPDEMAAVVAKASKKYYPRLPFVNGFCFMIKREVIDKIGFMDEENFPIGYGEENDFCIRAADAGYELAIADDTYVFHAKSKSFGHSRRSKLSKQGTENLNKKHGSDKFKSLVEKIKDTKSLDRVRRHIVDLLLEKKSSSIRNQTGMMSMKVLFLLPVKGGSGGAHSVVQEVTEMIRLGIDAKIAVRENDLAALKELYQDVFCINEIFVGFNSDNIVKVSEDYDVVVATIFNSVHLLQKIIDINPHILPAYYAQDYEPMFFPKNSENWQIACDSYSLIPNALVFAKTHWIADKIQHEHGIKVHKVSPSIDHETYKPALRKDDGLIHISAMIRPQTPRRGAERTMRLFSRLAKSNPGRLAFDIFGCESDDERFKSLIRDFDFNNSGILNRPAVSALLAKSDIFVDLSDYQAFGRTALEAMACGATAMVPIHGGTDEYAQNDINALVVDSFDEELCFMKLDALVKDVNNMKAMQSRSLMTAANYSVHQAAITELCLFNDALSKHRAENPKKNKPTLFIMPEKRSDGIPSESGYMRIILPYAHTTVLRNWKLVEIKDNNLPEPIASSTLVIQRFAGELTISQLEAWLIRWRAAGGKLIYDIDENLLDENVVNTLDIKHETASVIDKVLWLAKNADKVIVSSCELENIFNKYNQYIYLSPTRLDKEIWRIGKPRLTGKGVFQKNPHGPVRIGYIGKPHNIHELSIITDAMIEIQKKYGDKIEIEVIGCAQTTKPLFGKRVGLPKRNDYPHFVDWLHRRVNWDIGLIPLTKESKEDPIIKMFEYSALGLTTVISNVETYSNLHQYSDGVIIVNNETSAWTNALSKLIDDELLRNKINNNTYRYLTDNSAKSISYEFLN